jgi:hypothetical protein
MAERKKRARTRKEMFDAMSPEEQEIALQEMTYPYPLREAVDLDVAEEEMQRRHGGEFDYMDDYNYESGRMDQSGKRFGHDRDSEYNARSDGRGGGHQRELDAMLDDQAARFIVDAVKEGWSRGEVAEELDRHPRLDGSYLDAKGHFTRLTKEDAKGSRFSKKVAHLDANPEGKYMFGRVELPEWAKKELDDAGYDLSAPMIKSQIEQLRRDLSFLEEAQSGGQAKRKALKMMKEAE